MVLPFARKLRCRIGLVKQNVQENVGQQAIGRSVLEHRRNLSRRIPSKPASDRRDSETHLRMASREGIEAINMALDFFQWQGSKVRVLGRYGVAFTL
jgi:hypothetical protein